MKRRNFILSVLALILIACAVISPTVAYFTANADAEGSIPISFQYRTVIEDSVVDWLKTVRIQNVLHPDPTDTTIESDPIWVRARAFSGETYPLVEAPAAAGDWIKNSDGWWYYQRPLLAGEFTTGITFELTGFPSEAAEDINFTTINVGVVYETTLVRYNPDGTTYADWTIKLNSVTEGGY